jgi:hypothetical protein
MLCILNGQFEKSCQVCNTFAAHSHIIEPEQLHEIVTFNVGNVELLTPIERELSVLNPLEAPNPILEMSKGHV